MSHALDTAEKSMKTKEPISNLQSPTSNLQTAIEQQAAEYEDYYAEYVTENVPCPVCGAKLTIYTIPAQKLWTWPGHFYNPMIALGIFCAYDAPKGEIHSLDRIHHIWTGTGKYRKEKLIHLIPPKRSDHNEN
jgi:hypothetical protein